MELTIGRNSELHHGFSVSDSHGNTVLRIDGKKEDSVPVLLLTLDQHVLYGLSHPKVISKILTSGPNTLITQKKIAHSLYEHGMKACCGSVKILNNTFQATIETYYDVKYQHNISVCGEVFQITSWLDEEENYATIKYGNTTYLLSTIDIKPNIPHNKFVNISSITDYIVLEFNDK